MKEYHLQIISSVFANLASGWFFVALGSTNDLQMLLFNLFLGILGLAASFKIFDMSKNYD